MGIERDYLMRQLMMLFDVIQRIFRLRKKGDSAEAQKEVQNFYSYLKIEADFKQLNIEEILDILQKKLFTNEQIEMIAFVLKEQGELESVDERRIDFFKNPMYCWKKWNGKVLLFQWTGR